MAGEGFEVLAGALEDTGCAAGSVAARTMRTAGQAAVRSTKTAKGAAASRLRSRGLNPIVTIVR